VTDDPLDQIREQMEAEARLDPDEARELDLRARVYTLAELASVETRAAEPLLGPFIRRKWRTVVLGHTGEGKTTFTTRMMGALINGEMFLGYRAVKSTVMFIDLEQDETMAQERTGEAMLGAQFHGDTLPEAMAAIDAAHTSWYCRWTEGLALDEQSRDRKVLRDVIEERRPDVVMLDPLYKAFMGNPNEQQLASQVMRFLDLLREEFGFALVVPMHPRKEQQGVTARRLTKHDAAGSGGWIWGSEMIVGIERYPGSQANLLFFKDRSNTVEPDTRWLMRYDRANGYTRIRESQAGGPSSTVDAVLDELRKHAGTGEWFTREDVQSLVGREERTVRNAMIDVTKAKQRGRLPRLEIQKGARGKNYYRWSQPTNLAEELDDTRQQNFDLGEAEE
jgi:hypothetical protein